MGKLTDTALRALKPQDRIYNRPDGRGLSIEVWPNGGRYWRFRYRYAGKPKRLSLGVYPEISLKHARESLDAARALLRAGVDPSRNRKEAKAATRSTVDRDFVKVSTDWLEHNKPGWADATYRKAKYVVEEYLQPALKGQDMATLASPEARRAISAIAARAPALADKARGYLGSLVEYAINQGMREDGRFLSLRGVVPKRQDGHIPAATDVDDVRAVATAVAAYPIPVTRAALETVMLTVQRPGSVAAMEWKELDLDAAEWVIPPEKMKMRRAHVVPLTRQTVNTLRGMLAYTDGKRFVFPPLARQATEHLHRDALSAALRRMGFQGEHATHGFRAMFRTVARERLNVAPDVLEAQLAHSKGDKTASAYDRARFIGERRTVMQLWADYLDGLRNKV